MERSGSGLSKIRDAQMHSANFIPDRLPVFYSDRSQFMITLPNLNYNNDRIKDLLSEDGREQDRDKTGDKSGNKIGNNLGNK